VSALQLRADPDAFAVVQRIAELAHARGGRALVVGGAVRDAVLGKPSKDLDVEVYGLAPSVVETMIASEFAIDQIGESFGILKIQKYPVDVSLPRRESKAGLGHRGFDVLADPGMSITEAAARRDFTMNAMSYDPRTDELFDPYGGAADLHAGVLKHTSAAFGEDPLRVLRAMQFAARFRLTMHTDTVAVCRAMEMEGLPRERLFDEWAKLLVHGAEPSRGLKVLEETGWLAHFWELDVLKDIQQDPVFHPEGNVLVHTAHCLDAFARERIGDEWEDLVVGFAVLCHDMGKASTTARGADGRWHAYGHASAGAEPTRSFLARLTNMDGLVRAVTPLVTAHMEPDDLYKQAVGDAAIRRLSTRVGRIDRLVRVVRADYAGRPPLVFARCPAGDWLLERAGALAVIDRAPSRLVMGRHLIGIGLKPGREFASILTSCYEAQLEGAFSTTEEGTEFARRLVASTDRAPRVSAAPPAVPTATVSAPCQTP